ncbi:C-GCAxxG-C-C family (seleno)protein [Eubacteriaceae bacterium ES3]|nr:C-GCAxxG-C-C family (seleno)protein [Eubacteriaceae bacterium ES3]
METLVEKYNQVGSDAPDELKEQYHMCCSEVLLAAANEAYNLNLPGEAFKLIQGFGGGFYSEKVCGAFSGALAGLGAMYAKDRPTDMKEIKMAAKFLVEEFEKEFTTLDCDVIKAKYRDEITACDGVKCRAGLVLERVVTRMEEA